MESEWAPALIYRFVSDSALISGSCPPNPNICDLKDSPPVNELPVPPLASAMGRPPLYLRLHVPNVLENDVRCRMSILPIERMRGFLKLPL